MNMLSGFSRESDYIHIRLSEDARYFQVRLYPRICLRISTPTPFNVLFRQYAGLSLLRPHFAPYASTGLLTCSSIRCAFRLLLRSRLTLNRLTLFRNPQSSGGRGSRPPYRYLYYERPATVEEIAAAVGNDEALAAETYLAARLVCADLSRKEIVFLSRLSQALKLDDQLVENLEKQLDLA